MPSTQIQYGASTKAQLVDQLVDQMSLHELAGQMTQVTLEVLCTKTGGAEELPRLDPAALERVLIAAAVGSVLNVYDRALTRPVWHQLIREIQHVATSQTRLGIPVLYGIDAIHGHTYHHGALLHPHNLNLGATFDPALVEALAQETAKEVAAAGHHWNFAPVLDVGRQPLWSRFSETFGEDVYAVTMMGEAAVRGLSSRQDVASCGKHFLGYSGPQTGRDRTDLAIAMHALREYYLPPFRAAIAAGVDTIMLNSGSINGVPVHACSEIVTGLLREELGFDGVVVSDWEDVIKLQTVHRVAASPLDAVVMSLNAGVDMSMTPLTLEFPTLVVQAVESGRVSLETVQRAVRRILALKLRTGLLSEKAVERGDGSPRSVVDTAPASNTPAPEIEDQRHDLIYKSAVRSIVCLRDSRPDPLEGTAWITPESRVLMVGRGADERRFLHGPWSYTWQGDVESAYATELPPTLAGAMRAAGATVTVVNRTEALTDIDAATYDIMLIVASEVPSVEKPGDIDSLRCDDERSLFEAALTLNLPSVGILLTGRPRDFGPMLEQTNTLFWAGWPGAFGGVALVDILMGQELAQGRLPFTYPSASNALIPYDHSRSDEMGVGYGLIPNAPFDGYAPRWPFGFSAVHNHVVVDNLRLHQELLANEQDVLEARVDVKNDWDRAIDYILQVFVADEVASISPPVKRLRHAAVIRLAPRERKTITFSVPCQRLAFEAPGGLRLEDGWFTLSVEQLSTRFQLKR